MIAREGFAMSHKKVRRIYCEEKLQVRCRGGRKRALGTRKPTVLPDGPNQRWSLDFVSDALADSRRFRILAVSQQQLARRTFLERNARNQGRFHYLHFDRLCVICTVGVKYIDLKKTSVNNGKSAKSRGQFALSSPAKLIVPCRHNTGVRRLKANIA